MNCAKKNRRALLRLFRARLVNLPVLKGLFILCWHSAWTLVNSAREDSLGCDSELPVFEIKRQVTVTLMVFFFVFGSFLIVWANLRFVFDEFKRLPHAQRKRRDVKDTFLDLTYKSLFFSSHRAPWTAQKTKKILIFLLILCESVFFNEVFSTQIFFHAICRTLNRSICLAFTILRKGSFNETHLVSSVGTESAGLLGGRSLVQTPAGPKLRVF